MVLTTAECDIRYRFVFRDLFILNSLCRSDIMPPKKNQQNEDEMEEIRKYLSFMSEEISKV